MGSVHVEKPTGNVRTCNSGRNGEILLFVETVFVSSKRDGGRMVGAQRKEERERNKIKREPGVFFFEIAKPFRRCRKEKTTVQR